MSALLEQHERWAEVHKRLFHSPPAKPKPALAAPRSPFHRDAVAKAVEAVKADHALAVVFPNLHAVIGAAFPLSSIILPPQVPTPTWKLIALDVAKKHGVTFNDMLSPRRASHLVVARQEAMWRCKQETTMSLPQIGRRFNRDHTTALHSIRKHEQRLSTLKTETHAPV